MPHIQPERSVLPGCGLAIAFIRIHIREDVHNLVDKLAILRWQDTFDPADTFSTISCSVHVGDVSPPAVGSLIDIIMYIVCAADGFVTIARKLKMLISDKYVLSFLV